MGHLSRVFAVLLVALFALGFTPGPLPPADLPSWTPEPVEGALSAEEEDEIVAEIRELEGERRRIEAQLAGLTEGIVDEYERAEEEESPESKALLRRLQKRQGQFEEEREEARKEELSMMQELHDMLVQRERPEPTVEPVSPDDEPPFYRPYAMGHLRAQTDRLVEYHEEMARLHTALAQSLGEEQPWLLQAHEEAAGAHRSLARISEEHLHLVERLYEAYFDPAEGEPVIGPH